LSSIDRKAHCLLPEKTLAMPRHLIFVDTETTPEELENGRVQQRLRMGWACYHSRQHGRHIQKDVWFYFDDCNAFWQFVFKHTGHKEKLWVIARNLVFDFTVVKGWQHLREAGYKLKFFHNKGSTAIISVRNKSNSILFVDSLNWFRESLAETGKRIGLPKLNIDFDTCSQEYLSIYCRRDVEIELANFKLFIEFLQSNHISRLCYTIGSTAMAAYLFGHYHHTIYIHNNEQAIELERDSFRGGRVECFFIGEKSDENYYVLDVNSLYPFVMLSNLYPYKYKTISQNVRPETLADILKDKAVIAKVLIQTNEPVYAVKRKRMIFPIGRFWTFLTTPELKYAFAAGHILAVDRYVVYEQADLFSSYVKRFYALRHGCRALGEKQYEKICKLLLNSLYGKFGQKADEWEKIGDCLDEPDRVEEVYDPETNKRSSLRYLLGEVFLSTGFVESFNSFPAISSHVTAYGRLYLWGLIKQAGKENVFYGDTDSLIVNETGFSNLYNIIDDTELGKLKIEYITRTLTIRGLKDYTTDQKCVIKGIRKTAEVLGNGVYRQEKWPSFRGTLRSGNADVYIVDKITKTLRRNYTKGDIRANGSVVPFVLAEPVPPALLL